jgi:hypothetical protein
LAATGLGLRLDLAHRLATLNLPTRVIELFFGGSQAGPSRGAHPKRLLRMSALQCGFQSILRRDCATFAGNQLE